MQYHLQVDVADPAFPRSTGYWWFGCKSAPSGTIGGRANQIASDDQPSNEEDTDMTDRVFDAGGIDWDAYGILDQLLQTYGR